MKISIVEAEKILKGQSSSFKIVGNFFLDWTQTSNHFELVFIDGDKYYSTLYSIEHGTMKRTYRERRGDMVKCSEVVPVEIRVFVYERIVDKSDDKR